MTFMKRIAGAAALGAALLTGLASVPAQAGYVVTLEQVGPNVVANGSGTLDVTDLTNNGIDFNTQNFVIPSYAEILTGAGPAFSYYYGITGPTSFGSLVATNADSSSGDVVGVFGSSTSEELLVPQDYVSRAPLSSSATWLGQSFASLGVMPGTYEWTWGTGRHADSFTLIIPAVTAVPEPASLALLGTALAGLLLAGAIRRA